MMHIEIMPERKVVKSETNKTLKRIGSHLQYIRQKKGIKQEFLAQKLAVTSSYISKIENGKTQIYLTTFIKYCIVLDVATSDVLKEIGQLSNFL